MKIAIITDTHAGARSDSLIIDDYFKKFYDNIFFPYIDKNKIETVFHLGDAFDRRKYINYNILDRVENYLFKPLSDRNIDFHMITGNHDIHWKHSNELNSPDLLLAKYDFNLYSAPKEVTFDNLKVAFLPWVCTDNYKESMDFLGNTDASFLFAHLEIQGFEMNKGSICATGFDKKLFDKFDTVTSGHFHTKSRSGNIFYPGTAYEMTWADYNDPKGFNVFDTESKKFEFVRNPHTIFKKIYYDDSSKTLEEILDIEDVEGAYIKIIVKNKTNPYWFDLYLDTIDKKAPIQTQIIESSIYLNDEDEEFLDECEDTLSLIKKYCAQVETSSDKKKLESFITSLYNEAVSLED